MKTLFHLLPLLFIAYSSFSQNEKTSATLILNDNTIKYGTLKYGDWETTPNKIQFKATEDKDYVSYTPADVKSFQTNDVKYISKTLLTDNTPITPPNLKPDLIFDTTTKNIFIKQLVWGKVSLYEYINHSGVPNYYIENKKDSINLLIYKIYIDGIQIETIEKYKSQLAYYFSDCPNVISDTSYVSYNEKSLIGFFQRCNKYNGANFSSVKSEKLKYTFDAYGGITYGNIKFSGSKELLYSGSKYKSFASYTFLVSVGLPIIKKFQRRNIIAELGMKDISVVGTDSFKGGLGASYLADINLKYSYLKGNLLYRQYVISKERLKLFADLGFSLGFAYRINDEVKNITNGIILKNTAGVNKTDASVIAGFGTCINRLVGVVRYEQGNLLNINNTVSSSIKMLYILVGYRIF